MRTTSKMIVAALGALASTALAACAATDGANANDDSNVTIQNGSVAPLAVDAGFDSGPGGGGNGSTHAFKTTSDVATAQNGYYDSQFFIRAGKGTDGKIHIDFSSSMVDPTSWACVTPPWWDPYWPPPPPFCGYTRRTFTSAYGTLPNGTYRSGSDGAYLNATLANGPTLFVSSCTYDDTTWSYTCATDPGGVVDLRWRSNGFYSSTVTGSREETYGPFKMRTSGSYSSRGADVTGTVLGMVADGSYGQLVRSTGAALQFDSSLKP